MPNEYVVRRNSGFTDQSQCSVKIEGNVKQEKIDPIEETKSASAKYLIKNKSKLRNSSNLTHSLSVYNIVRERKKIVNNYTQATQLSSRDIGTETFKITKIDSGTNTSGDKQIETSKE